jgi:transposase-like protein
MTPDIDDVAVERAIQGDRSVRLNRHEVARAHRLLADRGLGARSIAAVLGVSERAVTRWRAGATPQSRKAAS